MLLDVGLARHMCLTEHRPGTDLAARNGLSKKERGTHRHMTGPQKQGPKGHYSPLLHQARGALCPPQLSHALQARQTWRKAGHLPLLLRLCCPEGLGEAPEVSGLCCCLLWKPGSSSHRSGGRGPWDPSPSCSAYKGLSDISPPYLPSPTQLCGYVVRPICLRTRVSAL